MPQVTKKVYAKSATYDNAERYANLSADDYDSHYSPISYDVHSTGNITYSSAGYETDVYCDFSLTEITNAISAKVVLGVNGKSWYNSTYISSINASNSLTNASMGFLKSITPSGNQAVSYDLSASQVAYLNEESSTSFKMTPNLSNVTRVYKGGTGTGITNGTGLCGQRQNRVAYCMGGFSEYLEKSYIEYTCFAPAISTLTVTGTSIDSPITCTWAGEDIASWQVQVILNGVVKVTQSGTTETSCTFATGTFTEAGNYTFKLIATNNSSVEETATAQLTNTVPTADTFTVTGTNIDSPITCTWTGTNISSWQVQAIQNGTVRATKTGTAGTSCIFNAGDITITGDYTFSLTVTHAGAGYTTYANKTATATLTRTEPKVVTLEPSGVTANKDAAITCSWSTQNQHSFRLIFDGHEYTGTTATSISIPANTITSLGTKSITLTISYTSSWGEVRTDAKTVTFTAVGKPNTPVLDNYAYYSIATPTFTWTCVDAFQQYRVQVLSGNTMIDDSNDTASSTGSYTCQTALSNDASYTVKVKVKTAYGYWSDWASKSFSTNFVVANKPSIAIYATDMGVVINSTTVYSEAFDHCDIYRKTDTSDWVRIGYNMDNLISLTDTLVGAGNYYYKVTSVSTSGGLNDSDTAMIRLTVDDFVFCNAENTDDKIMLSCNPQADITINRNTAASIYEGVYAPIIDIGDVFYRTGSFSFAVKKSDYVNFVNLVRQSKVLLYRDRRGNRFYCQVVGNITTEKLTSSYDVISFAITEVPVREKDMYCGQGNLPLAFFDGTYYFDGSIYFDGEGTEVNE